MKGKEAVLDHVSMRRVNELCAMGARPPVIHALLPDFPRDIVVNLWVMHNGKRPPKGPLPSDANFYLNGSTRRLQSSLIIKTFQKLRDTGVHDIDALISTYKQYNSSFSHLEESVRYSMDRVWGLIREFVSVRSVTMVCCPHCKAEYIHKALEIVNHRYCPMRKLVAHYESVTEIAKNPELVASDQTVRHLQQDEFEHGVIAMPFETHPKTLSVYRTKG